IGDDHADLLRPAREIQVVTPVLTRRVGRPALIAGLAPIGLLRPQRAGVAPVDQVARTPDLPIAHYEALGGGIGVVRGVEPRLAVPHADLRIADAAAGD